MKGLDTNIIIRFLVGDDEQQTKKAYHLFKEAELNKKELCVPLVVTLEVIWVLESAYQIQRDEILDAINELLLMPILKFEHQSALQQFIRSGMESKYDLSDLLIAHSAKEQGCESVITFDKRASKFDLFELA